MSHKLNIFEQVFYIGGFMPFYTIIFEFDKMRIPTDNCIRLNLFIKGLCDNNRGLRFCAITSVVALFLWGIL